MKLVRACSLIALLAALGAGISTAAAAPGGSSAAVTGNVALGSQALLSGRATITTEVTWHCSPRAVAVLVVDVVQQSPLLVPSTGFGRRILVCDGATHTSAVTVLGSFQLGEAVATATLTPLGAPLAAFTDQRTIQIVHR